MAKTINELNSKEKESFYKFIDEKEEEYIQIKSKIGQTHSKYGLCSTCTLFQYCKTEFRIKHAKCAQFNIILNSGDPVIECTNYVKKGELTLYNMQTMAYIIDISEKEIGFIKKDRK